MAHLTRTLPWSQPYPDAKDLFQPICTSFCPHISIYRAGDEIYWGLYPSDTNGDNTPLFKTSKDSNYVVYDALKKHFTAQREKVVNIGEDLVLVNTMLGEPILNTKLAEEILGPDAIQLLLK